METVTASKAAATGGLTKGELLHEGKTKRIFSVAGEEGLVLVESKDSISAFNGVRSHEIEGKAAISNDTNGKIFKFLNDAGIRTSFRQVEEATSFSARRCEMIPVEFVARRVATGSFLKRNPGVQEGFRFKPTKLETFFKDDANNDPQWSEEQITEANWVIGGIKIGRTEHEIMTKTTQAVFEILERSWQFIGCTLVDMKIEFGVDVETKEILLSDVIDSDSWRLWPSGDKRLMKDKQVYRNLTDVTKEALEAVKTNFIWVSDNLDKFFTSPRGMVVIIMGSRSDVGHCEKIKSHCDELGLQSQMRVSSAHKCTDTTLRIVSEYEDMGTPIVFIAVAGRSNGLGPVISGNTVCPVINCPPMKTKEGTEDIWSSLKVPSGLGCSTVIYPEAAALQAASILGQTDHVIWSRLRARLLNNWSKIATDDQSLTA